MNTNNYSMEEMENAAVKKNEMAKKLAIGAAVAVGSAGTALGATALLNSDDEPASEEAPVESKSTTDDLLKAAEIGSSETELPPAPAEDPQVQVINVNVHTPATEPDDTNVEFGKSTVVVDDNGDYVGSVDYGKVDGTDFALVDQDGDYEADILWIDRNEDQAVQEDELMDVKEYAFSMGNGTVGPDDIVVLHDDGSTPDIPNDFDHTDDNWVAYDQDYDNHGDVDQFSASANVATDTPAEYDHSDMSLEADVDHSDILVVEDTPADDYAMAEPEPAELSAAPVEDIPVAENDFASLDSSATDDFSSHDDIDVAMV